MVAPAEEARAAMKSLSKLRVAMRALPLPVRCTLFVYRWADREPAAAARGDREEGDGEEPAAATTAVGISTLRLALRAAEHRRIFAPEPDRARTSLMPPELRYSCICAARAESFGGGSAITQP
jgi:hypothetical protein